jgi:hypothetical protein
MSMSKVISPIRKVASAKQKQRTTLVTAWSWEEKKVHRHKPKKNQAEEAKK